MLITTGDEPSVATLERAHKLAKEFTVRFVPRRGRSVTRLAAEHGNVPVMVIVENEVRLVQPGEKAMFFHPSMAFVRAKRLLKGEEDVMVSTAMLEPGDHILDCTAGLGADSLVFALATGSNGLVTSLESSLPLSMLLTEGLRSHKTGLQPFDEAMQRIQVVNENHTAYLSRLPDKSMDIVYFDPMFREAVHESSAIAPLRNFANDGALAPAAIADAVRVARKAVLLKEKWDSPEYERLGFQRIRRKKSKIEYGVIYP
ncbi:class I SAM-dependent methyltransferase [Paenibacillus campi]|uniref:class I SAM-dependent methyltransferase n=1 Tax=Paenibacillus campi TaxID=3106031 RepID=UPI002AFDEDCA|nr:MULTISPECIES: class I SAM-dependent methyltransferase [unclassified Paenibacillus]